MEHQLSSSHDKWLVERQKLIDQKDAERRKAVEEAQDQVEQDYRVFLTEHQDTLDKALKSAREEFATEKVCTILYSMYNLCIDKKSNGALHDIGCIIFNIKM